MDRRTRRQFLQSTTRTGVGIVAGTAPGAAAVGFAKEGPPQRLRLAIVGIRGRGGHHAKQWASKKDCEVAYLCDVEESLFPAHVAEVSDKQGTAPKTTSDFRRALDDKSVDAIIIATPDHWHAL